MESQLEQVKVGKSQKCNFVPYIWNTRIFSLESKKNNHIRASKGVPWKVLVSFRVVFGIISLTNLTSTISYAGWEVFIYMTNWGLIFTAVWYVLAILALMLNVDIIDPKDE